MKLFFGVRAEEMVLFWVTCKRIITTYQYQHKVNELWLNLPTQFALSARDLTHPILNPMRAGYCSIEFTESQTVGNFKPRTDLIVSIGSNNSLVGRLHFHMPAEQHCASCLACVHSYGKQSPLRRALVLKERQYFKLRIWWTMRTFGLE